MASVLLGNPTVQNAMLNPVHALVQQHAAQMDMTMKKHEREQHLWESETDIPEEGDSDRGLDTSDDDDDDGFDDNNSGSPKNPQEKSARRGLLSSKVVRRSLRNAQKLLKDNHQHLSMEPPPVPMEKLREMTQKPALLKQELQQNPTLFYEIYRWCQRVVSMVYDAMKSVMESAIRRMHSLAVAMTDSAADLRDLELFKNDIHGVMGKFLNMAHHMKSKLEELKADLMKMTKNTGIVELKKGGDAVVLQHRLHDMMKSLKQVQHDFLGSIRTQWASLETKQNEAIQKQREELDKVKQRKPSILDNFKGKGVMGAIVGAGGVLVIGALVVGLLAGLAVVSAPILCGIASAFAVVGGSAAAFGAIVGRNLESAENGLSEKVKDVSESAKDIGITLGVMKNSIEMVADSLKTLAESFSRVAKQIQQELLQFDGIKDQLLAFSVDDWCDVSKVRALKSALPSDDSMENLDGDEVSIDLNPILKEMDHAAKCIDSFVNDIRTQMEVMKPTK